MDDLLLAALEAVPPDAVLLDEEINRVYAVGEMCRQSAILIRDLRERLETQWNAWPIMGVRVEDDTVVVKVKGGNDAARWLCGEFVDRIKAGPL